MPSDKRGSAARRGALGPRVCAARAPPRPATPRRAAAGVGRAARFRGARVGHLGRACGSGDIEAVEAVSEILTRFAPGGTSVEPGSGLTNEGLGAVVDREQARDCSGRICRGLIPTWWRHAIAEATIALGHLQAFGAAADRRADDAGRARGRLGRGMEEPLPRCCGSGGGWSSRPTWRRHRRLPGDVVLSLDPGMAFWDGLHPTTRLCLAALEIPRRRGLVAEWPAPRTPAPGGGAGRLRAAGSSRRGSARVLDVGCGSGILHRRASSGRATCSAVDTDPIAVESTLATRASTG